VKGGDAAVEKKNGKKNTRFIFYSTEKGSRVDREKNRKGKVGRSSMFKFLGTNIGKKGKWNPGKETEEWNLEFLRNTSMLTKGGGGGFRPPFKREVRT